MGLMTTVGVLLKTFISYNMAKGEQIENFMRSEQIRKEMEEKYLEDAYKEYTSLKSPAYNTL